MISNNKDCVRTLLVLARQTKNYACDNNFSFEMDVNELTDALDNSKKDDINYLIDRVNTSLLEDGDKRAAVKLTQLNEIQVYVENN